MLNCRSLGFKKTFDTFVCNRVFDIDLEIIQKDDIYHEHNERSRKIFEKLFSGLTKEGQKLLQE